MSPTSAVGDDVEEGEVATEPIRRLSFSPAAASAEPTPSKPTPKKSALSKERLGLLSIEKALQGISEETGPMIKVTPIKAAKAPRREVSSSEENSDESDSDSAVESKSSKSSKKKEKKEKMRNDIRPAKPAAPGPSRRSRLNWRQRLTRQRYKGTCS